jgi:hypothetical protein
VGHEAAQNPENAEQMAERLLAAIGGRTAWARVVAAVDKSHRPSLSGQAGAHTIRDLPLREVCVSQYQAMSVAFRAMLPVRSDRMEPYVMIGGRMCHPLFIDSPGERRHQVQAGGDAANRPARSARLQSANQRVAPAPVETSHPAQMLVESTAAQEFGIGECSKQGVPRSANFLTSVAESSRTGGRHSQPSRSAGARVLLAEPAYTTRSGASP